jgi:hypothetical protein
VRFVKISAQPSWSLSLFRSCGLSAPARSHEPCSLGFHRVCLSAGIPAAVLSRCASAPSDSRCQPAVAFRSRGFSPPQRFAPTAALRACCIPLPARGSSLFQHPCPPTAETVGGAPRTPFQATLLTPFRVFPSPAAVPRHPPCTACFHAETPKCFNLSASRLGGSPTAVALVTFPLVRLPLFHHPVARTASNRDLPESVAFKALLHCRVRCDAPSLLTALRSLLPWA